MSLDRQLVVLTQQQISASEGLEMLRKVKEELDDNAGSMELWGMITILSNLVIIPLNCIVNALELKAADTVIKSIYQAIISTVYENYAKSGTRVDGIIAKLIKHFKAAVLGEIKRRGAKDMIPVANILIGLVEDTLALWQAIERSEGGKSEIKQLKANLDAKILTAERNIIKLGTMRLEVIEQKGIISRMA